MPLWTPTNLTVAPAVWLDASDSASITHSSGRVSQWSDKSGNARHAVQATSGRQPLYSATGFDGTRPGITYAKSRPDQLDIAWSHTGALLTAFAVFDTDSGTGDDRILSFGNSGSDDWGSPSRAFIALSFPGDRFKIGRNPAGEPNLGLPDAAGHIGYGQFTGTGMALRVNDGTAGTEANTFANFNFTLVRVGGYVNNTTAGAEHFNGKFAEFVVLAYTPTTDERERIAGYLAHRWGIEAKLPSGHTYRTDAPTTGAAAQLISVKHAGTWKLATVYVKHAGVWKQPTVSVKHAGVWKVP